MKPWEKYQSTATVDSAQQKPWEKYGGQTVQPPPSQPVDSVATQGSSYITQHPYKTAFQPIAQTLTGKSLLDRSQGSAVFSKPPSNPLEFLGEYGAGLTRDIGAYGADMATTPANIAGSALAATKPVQMAGKAIAGSGVGQMAGKVFNSPLEKVPGKTFNYFKDVFTGSEKARIVGEESKFALRQATQSQARDVATKAKMKVGIVKQNQDAVTQTYNELSDTLKKMIVKSSDKESLTLQKDLPRLFGKKSQEYGKKLNSLFEGKDITVPAENAVQGLQDSLLEHGILRQEGENIVLSRAPMTPAEHEVYNLYTGTKRQLLDNPGATVQAQDLMRSQKYMEPKFGKAWTPDDKLKASVAENLSSQLTDAVPGLKDLRTEYKPFLEWKKQAIKEFQPFSNQYETAKSSGLISKIGSQQIRPDEQRLMAGLRKALNREVGGKVPALQKGLNSIPDKQQAIQQASSEAIQKIRSDAAKEIYNLRKNKDIKIHDINQSVDRLVAHYSMEKLKLAIAGGVIGLSADVIGRNALQYFFRREIYSGLHGNF